MKRTLLATCLLVAGLTGCGTDRDAAEAPSSTAPASAVPAASGPPLPPPDPRVAGQVEKMKALEYMVGQWHGRGTSFDRTGKRSEFEQTETVGYRLSGELLLIEGRGTHAENSESLAFRALATARWDAATQRYLWWAASRGSVLEVPLEVRPDGFTWSFSSPGFSFRNTATFGADTWSEKSEQSFDGGLTWQPQVEMTLTRVP